MSNNSDKDLKTLLEEIKIELFDYINKKIRFYKLDLFEKFGFIISILGFGAILAVITLFILFFMLFSMAFFIGELVGNTAAGFGILAAFCIFLVLILILCGKKLRRFILNKTIIFMQKIDSNETEEN